jgi:ankyrin repeat protein
VRIRHALDELPVTVDETYERILGGIKSTNWEVARRLFQFVAVSFRPLHAEEVAEFLAFDFTVGPTPKFCGDLRLGDPEDAVLSTCSTLLALVNVDGSQVIRFSHFSAKKFLLSACFAKKCDTISHRYHISMTPAHTVVAQACLGILLHLDESVTKDSLRMFPLAEYAAKHWVDHVRFEDVSRNVEDGMKQLFDPKKAHFSVWVWIYDPGDPIWNPDRRSERPLQPSETPLHYAALCGLHTLVKFLVIERSQDVNASTIDDDSTPLHRASERGHAEVARSLLNHNANSDSRNDENWTSLHLASQHGHLEVVLALLEHCTDVNARDHSKWTPLHEASQNGHLEVVQVLLEWGANADALDYGGWSPLQLPSRKGHLGVVRVILEHGVDANTRDNSNLTPLHGASQQGHLEVVRVLLEHGANIDSQDDSNQTPLHLASRAGHLEVVRVLLEHGAKTDSQDDSNQTPLHLASRAGHLQVVRVLLKHDANIDSQDDSNQTPLHLASRAGHLEIVQLLVEYNASVYMQNNKGRTAFQEASVAGHDNVMQLLLDHGAENTVG